MVPFQIFGKTGEYSMGSDQNAKISGKNDLIFMKLNNYPACGMMILIAVVLCRSDQWRGQD